MHVADRTVFITSAAPGRRIRPHGGGPGPDARAAEVMGTRTKGRRA